MGVSGDAGARSKPHTGGYRIIPRTAADVSAAPLFLPVTGREGEAGAEGSQKSGAEPGFLGRLDLHVRRKDCMIPMSRFL